MPTTPRPDAPMAADSDQLSPAERLIQAFATVTRWVSKDLGSDARAGSGARPRGCAHPLTLIKVVIFLVVVVACPVFLLPYVLVRAAQTGRTGFRYGASVNVASGEQARWGHGALPPAPGAGEVTAGAAAIGSRDPGFRASALTDWAVAATALLRQSLVSGDPACARTFMANGLYRAHQALLELRDSSNVSCRGSWHAVDATVAGATRGALVEEVRVRVRCQGWRWERHEPTGLTLRGGPDPATWSEDLTFSRAAGAVTPPGGGLPASRCPSCGADLGLDPGGACRYCKGVVTAGRHDWVLVSWQREPW
jgi:hypothetical protein